MAALPASRHAASSRPNVGRLPTPWLLLALGAGCGLSNNPDAHVNQLGYLPESSKVGVIEHESPAALEWQVTDASGAVALRGQTEVGGADADSGDTLHRADFSRLTTPGTGYRLVVDGSASHPFDIDARLYEPLKRAALAFFYHNRSGTPIEIPWAGQWQWTHGPGHLSDADVGCITDCGYRLDVRGGWYDAGDHGKYTVNGGIAVWTLLDAYERALYLGGSLAAFADGTLSIPESQNGVPDLLDEARWELEFLLAMQVPEGHEKAGMAHHKIHDTAWSTLGRVPPEMKQERFLHPPSTAATLNLAATAAQATRVFRDVDPEFADRCRLAAIRAWNAAQRFPAIYAPQYSSQGGGPYDDTDVSDEFYWAAAELYVSLDSPELLAYLEGSPHHLTFPTQIGHERVAHHTSFTWQGTAALGSISLAIVAEGLPDAGQVARLRQLITNAADDYLATIAAQGYRVPIRRGNNGHYPWGSNSLVLNNAVVLALAHDFTHDPKYLGGVVQAMDYILGRNPLGISYVSGFGEHAFENPHHRFWAHQKRSSFPHPPPGALAGGPNSRLQDPTSNRLGSCAPQRCYIDHVDAWSVNEVAINWNAPLAWVAAYLDERGASDAARAANSSSAAAPARPRGPVEVGSARLNASWPPL